MKNDDTNNFNSTSRDWYFKWVYDRFHSWEKRVMRNAYLIKAYADKERRLKEQERIVRAETKLYAQVMAYKLFPEYKEIGVYLMEDRRVNNER